jgi:hypothetical protein
MFIRAVGAHPSRIANLYFAFLFVTRAVAKAHDLLTLYDYSSGDEADKAAVESLIQQLAILPSIGNNNQLIREMINKTSSPALGHALMSAAQCTRGFDESALFQVR